MDAAESADEKRAVRRLLEDPQTGLPQRPHRFIVVLRDRHQELLLGDRPFIVLLEQDSADQANGGPDVAEDPDDVRPGLDLLVQPLQGIRAVQLPAMLLRKMLVRQDVLGGLIQQRRRLGKPRAQAVRDLAQLRQGARVSPPSPLVALRRTR